MDHLSAMKYSITGLLFPLSGTSGAMTHCLAMSITNREGKLSCFSMSAIVRKQFSCLNNASTLMGKVN